MPGYSEQSRLPTRHGTLTALFMSFVLTGCSVQVAAIASDAGDTMLTSTETIVGYAAAGGTLLVAAGQVSPILQRFALAIALTVGAFFMGNLSPQIIGMEFPGDSPLFYSVPYILVVALLFVAGFLAVLNKDFTFKKLTDIFGGFAARAGDRSRNNRVGERLAEVTEPKTASVDLFEFSQDALVVANAEGVVLELNRKAEIMFGWTRGRLVGRPVAVLIPHCEFARQMGPNDFPVHYSSLRTVAPELQKLQGLRKDGTTFAVEVSLSAGRSGGAYAVVASIRAVTNLIQPSASIQRGDGARNHTVDFSERIQADPQRQVLYASLERRLTNLIDVSVQSGHVAKAERSPFCAGTEASPWFEASESRYDDSLDELAESHWSARWATEEKNARACALSLLSVIDEMKNSCEIDASRLEVAGSTTAAKQRVENLCDRLFPTSRIMPS